MLDESLRRRLESLNRAPMPARAGEAPAGEAASAARRVASQVVQAPQHETVAPPRLTPGLLRSGETIENAVGEHLRVRMPLDDLWQNGTQLIAARHEYLQSQIAAAQQAIEPSVVVDPEFTALVAALPDRTVALDLETCGLAGSALFLIGLLRQINGEPTVELLLARNYAEEAAVLASLWQTLSDCDVLLSFNGKTFDWPMIQERSIRHRLQTDANRTQRLHIDILHHARRRWRNHLPNCRLQTLEQHVCRRHRTADIPGHCIPAVYADYVRTGFERDMETVLHHNALDLVTLFDLALRLAA